MPCNVASELSSTKATLHVSDDDILSTNEHPTIAVLHWLSMVEGSTVSLVEDGAFYGLGTSPSPSDGSSRRVHTGRSRESWYSASTTSLDESPRASQYSISAAVPAEPPWYLHQRVRGSPRPRSGWYSASESVLQDMPARAYSPSSPAEIQRAPSMPMPVIPNLSLSKPTLPPSAEVPTYSPKKQGRNIITRIKERLGSGRGKRSHPSVFMDLSDEDEGWADMPGQWSHTSTKAGKLAVHMRPQDTPPVMDGVSICA
jgi:hypothetical protein